MNKTLTLVLTLICLSSVSLNAGHKSRSPHSGTMGYDAQLAKQYGTGRAGNTANSATPSKELISTQKPPSHLTKEDKRQQRAKTAAAHLKNK